MKRLTVKQAGSRGGRNRAARMTEEERKAAATKAITARWAKREQKAS